ncbi:hypothetical protein ABHI18_000565 [Aspergillus niger]
MSIDTDVLIIGAGPSGLGMAVQLIRNFGTRRFEIIKKTSDNVITDRAGHTIERAILLLQLPDIIKMKPLNQHKRL